MFDEQIEDLEDKIYNLDEAHDLLNSAKDIIVENSDFIDLRYDIEGIAEELLYRIKELERTLEEAKRRYGSKD